MNRYLLLLLSLGIICTAPSCKLYRRITGKQKPVPVVDSNQLVRDSVTRKIDSVYVSVDTVVAPTIDPSQQALLLSLLPRWTSQTPWRTFSGKAKVHYEGNGENHDFTANIRMEKGARIWVSVVALGVYEAARVLITPDTIQILNRVNKEARILPFSQLGALLPIRGDFASLQNLIIGDAMQTGNNPNQARDTAGGLMLSFVSPDLTHTLQFASADTSLQFQAISAPEAFMLSQYSEYMNADGRRFAANRVMTMTDKGEPHSLNMEFSKASFDEAIETPFSIPDKYERK